MPWRAIAGLTDVDAITLSMSEFAKSGEARIAVIAIVIAALSNTLVKCGMAFVLAGATLGKPLLLRHDRDPAGGLGGRLSPLAACSRRALVCSH